MAHPKRRTSPITIRRSLEEAGTYDGGYLPEITVTGINIPYRSYYSEANDRILSDIGNVIKGAVRNAGDYIGDSVWYPIKTILSLQNNNKEDSYKNATIPYGQGEGHERDNVIQVRNGKAGEMDRLGMYGAIKGKDGVYRFKNPNYKKGDKTLQELKVAFGAENSTDYEFLKWCAENANRLNQALGLPTAGNAWTRHGIYGDSVIIKAPYKKADYTFGKDGLKATNLSIDQGEYVSENIDNHELKTGDIVDMYYKGSSYQEKAFKEGDDDRANSHTGTILKTGRDKEYTYVVHSTGNGLKIQPIGELIGGGRLKKSYITGIRRPGTKEHPYRNQKKEGGIHIAPSKRGTFTAAATKHGMGVQEFASRVLRNKDSYSPAMVKKANFARNASKWNH